VSDEDLEFVAHAAAAGIEPLQFFKIKDEMEMAALRLVAMKSIEVARKYREDQAQLIISNLSKAMDRGSRRSGGSQNTSSTRTRN
jgi:hypothetical protein